jgi:hypothetical protein
MAVDAGFLVRDMNGYASIHDAADYADSLLPDSVQQWAGLDSDSAKVDVPAGTECPNLGDGEQGEPCEQSWCHVCAHVSLVDLNDEKQATFEEIADVIEKWF